MSDDHNPHPETTLEVMPLAALFKNTKLTIPDYQRTYSWRDDTHVEVLLKDLRGCTKPYVMGTIVLHEDQDKHEIVDGQQRLVTLTILCKTVFPHLDEDELPLLRGKFSPYAAQLIRKAKDRIDIFYAGLAPKEKESLEFLLGFQRERGTSPRDGSSDNTEEAPLPSLLFDVLTLRGDGALDLAYTFFDSVNSKGKPLTDFDLLKAHHLMYIPDRDESLAVKHNKEWLRHDEKHAELFSELLRRIRMWARNMDRDSRDPWPDYEEFSTDIEPYENEAGEHFFSRYMQPAAFKSWRREGERIVLTMDIPIQKNAEFLLPAEITQTIEGGDAFFLYAKHYHKLYNGIFGNKRENCSSSVKFVHDLTISINDKYLRQAFKATMLLYIDKFGEHHLEEAAVCIERIISEWRWKSASVRVEGTLSHINNTGLVHLLLNAVSARSAREQLYKRALSVLRLPISEKIKGKPVVENYREKLKNFYTDKSLNLSLPFRELAISQLGCVPNNQETAGNPISQSMIGQTQGDKITLSEENAK